MIRGRRTRINYAKDWQYTTNDTATLVTKYIGTKTSVIVPNKIEGKPVVLQNSVVDSSGSGAYNGVFAGNQNIKSVKFEEGVSFANNNMHYAFHECLNLISAPVIPTNVTDLSYAFACCANLASTPNIPSKVTNMQSAFSRCLSITDAPAIPASVTIMTWAFSGCQNLVNAPDMSNAKNVTNMYRTFQNCTNLKNAPVIPANVTDMVDTFYNCYNLVNAPVIPANVTRMGGTFSGCINLINAPVIPANVTNVASTFYNCTNLVNAPVIPANVTSMYSTFCYCRNLKNAPVIPNSVTNMGYTFAYCYNLTGNIYIKSNRINNTSMQNCFNGTTLPKNVYIPSQGYNAVANTWNAAFNTTYGINGKNGVTVIDDAALDWTYTTNDTATLLTKYTGDKADVTVPTTLAAKPTMLSTAVFEGTSVNSVDLANTQFANNDMANTFNGCTNLKIVTNLTNTVNAMNYAFNNATNLKTVGGISATASIRMSNGYMAFANCTNLTSVPNMGIIASAANASTNVAYAFHNCSNLLNVNMPWLGIRIYGTASTFNGYKTFANCCNLTALETMGIAIIGNSNLSNMFQNTGISSLGNLSNDRGDGNDFGFSVIGNANMNGAFVGCKNLSTANFSSAIFDDGNANVNMPFVFYNCHNLTNVVNLPNGARNLSYGFADCSKLNEVTRLPKTVNDVSYTFSNCTNLKTAIDISDSVYTMQGTYKGCLNLSTVPIGAISLNTQYMDSTFENCSKLTKASIIPPNVTSITNVFRNCTNLAGNVVIYTNKLGNSVMSNAFNGTSKAKNIYIYNLGVNSTNNTWNAAFNTTYGINGKNGVNVINMGTWENSTWNTVSYNTSAYCLRKYLGVDTDVYVPDKIRGTNSYLCGFYKSTANAMFYGNTNIVNVKFGKNVNGCYSNGASTNRLFASCTNLKSVYGLPTNVDTGAEMFSGCTNLVYIDRLPNTDRFYQAFDGCTSLEEAPVIPNSVSNMVYMFRGCSNLKRVSSIPNSIAEMEFAFDNCVSLEDIPDIESSSSYLIMNYTFRNCKSLVYAPNLSKTNVDRLCYAFDNCVKLKYAPILSNNVSNLSSCFRNCSNLVNAPNIPVYTTYMESTFRDCVNLTGNIIINSQRINTLANCFLNTSKTKNVYVPFKGYNVYFNTYRSANIINGTNGVTIYDINTYKG